MGGQHKVVAVIHGSVKPLHDMKSGPHKMCVGLERPTHGG